MSTTPSSALLSEEIHRWILESFDSGDTIESVRALQGGMSAKVYRIDVKGKQGVLPVVLRLFTNREWNAAQPDLALREAANLRLATKAGIATPELITIDETGSRCGVPAVLMTHLPGTVELTPPDLNLWAEQLAEALLSVHQIDAPSTHPWHYHTYNDVHTLEIPAWSDFSHWEEVLRLVQGPRPEAKQQFIHRDYHPTNVLWQNQQASGVVDWVNGCLGPHGIDVGHCRLNLAQLCGVEVADRFLEAYLRLAGSSFAYDPYWDLLALIESLPGPPRVYIGWTALGVTALTDRLIKERYEAYVASVLRRF